MKKREGWFASVGRALVAVALVGACSARAKDVTLAVHDSESHFLSHCVPGSCAAGLECLFGICTEPCTTDADCAGWSVASVCRSLDDGEGSAVCDLECSSDADCARAGTSLACDAGRCRPLLDKARATGFSCTSDDGCAAGLRCVSNQCTSRCAADSDCSDGASCQELYDYSTLDALPQPSCVVACSQPEPFESSHDQCASLGPGGRCYGERCVETLSGQCGDVGQPDARWACYESLAPDLFRERQPALLEQTLCLPTTNGRYADVDFVRCPDPGCADAGGRCSVSGLVLEATATPQQVPNGYETIVMSAVGELRLREPVRLPFELSNPAERCEYAVDARFWGLQFFDSIQYLSAYTARSLLDQEITDYGTSRLPLSMPAIDGGFAQPARAIGFGHTGSRGPAISIEDSEAAVTLLSGGARCEAIRELVGTGLRVSLVDALNDTLYEWFAAQYDSVECSVCGTLGCELACRRR